MRWGQYFGLIFPFKYSSNLSCILPRSILLSNSNHRKYQPDFASNRCPTNTTTRDHHSKDQITQRYDTNQTKWSILNQHYLLILILDCLLLYLVIPLPSISHRCSCWCNESCHICHVRLRGFWVWTSLFILYSEVHRFLGLSVNSGRRNTTLPLFPTFFILCMA